MSMHFFREIDEYALDLRFPIALPS
jgi:hypothetical protein